MNDVNGNLTASTATGAAPASSPALPERRRPMRTLPQIACVLLSAVLLAALPAPSSAQWHHPNDELREGPLGDHRAGRVRELLAKGANPNVPGLGGNTAVHNAAGLAVVFLGYSRSLPLMLDHGGDPNAKNDAGNTPLHLAAGFAAGILNDVSSRDTVRLLLAHGAAPDVPNGNGDTPLHAAASAQDGSSVIRLLVRAGADPNKTNRWGDTPLHAFAKHNTDDDGDALGGLLDAGSDPNAVNRKRLTPLLLYVQRNGDDGRPVTRLVAAGADPNRKAPNGDTPLHIAVHEDKEDVVDALLAAGADPCIKDKEGLIPERHAAGGGNDYIQAVLERAGGFLASCGAREEERQLACAEEKGLRLDRAQRRRIQEALAAQGFDPGPADGSFGPRTRAAISGWQRAKGEAATECLVEGQALALQGREKETLAAAEAERKAQEAEEKRKREAAAQAAAEKKRKVQAAAQAAAEKRKRAAAQAAAPSLPEGSIYPYPPRSVEGLDSAGCRAGQHWVCFTKPNVPCNSSSYGPTADYACIPLRHSQEPLTTGSGPCYACRQEEAWDSDMCSFLLPTIEAQGISCEEACRTQQAGGGGPGGVCGCCD